MITSEGTQALIDLEDAEPDVLFATLPTSGTLIWPLLRWPLARASQEIELNTIAVPVTQTRQQVVTRIARAFLPNRFSPSHMSRHKDILFVVKGGTYRQTDTGRENWLVDAFARSLDGRAAIVQDLPIRAGMPAKERPDFVDTFSFADDLSRVEVSTRFHPLPAADMTAAREIIRAIFDAYPYPVDEGRIAAVERRLLYRLRRLPHITAQFQRLVDRVRPRAVFVEDASYGSRATLIQALKERGSLVIEPQHGWIGPYHSAYNFGAAMSRPELMKAMPDVLLTFGEFWSSHIRHPSELVAIGKPHLDAMSRMATQAQKSQNVVLISGLYERERLTRLALSIRDALPVSWTVSLRPHPSERATVRSLYPGLVDQPRIRFDEIPDVYESLTSARAVFGYASTVLYEALAFHCQVFVIDSPLADFSTDPATFGERISDHASLTRAIEAITTGSDPRSNSLEKIWAPNAAENFRRFVDARLARTSGTG